MADWGTAIFPVVDDTAVADVSTFGNYFNAIDWGVGVQSAHLCGSDTSDGITTFTLEVTLRLIQTMDLRYTVTFSPLTPITMEMILQNTAFLTDNPVTPGPVPDGWAGAGLNPVPLPAFRTIQYYLDRDIYREFPEFEELSQLLEIIHMWKYEHYQNFEGMAATLNEYIQGGQLTEAINLLFKRKQWPHLPRAAVSGLLRRIYDDDTAERIATALDSWSEQHVLDEEHNWRTVEEWASGVIPVYEL